MLPFPGIDKLCLGATQQKCYTESFAVNAVELHGAERDEIFARQARISPQFAHYQANTSRKIPVIALERQK